MKSSTWMALAVLTLGLTACQQAPAAAPTESPTAEAVAMPTEAPAVAPIAAPMADNSTVQLAEVLPEEVKGDIVSAGSSTVFPMSEAMVTAFKDEGYTGNISLNSVGTGAGFERFCTKGETDIAEASRAINDKEKEACAKIGREPIAFRIGTDALAIVVSSQNTFLTNITKDQLAQVYTPTVKTWADVDPSWPAEPIGRFSPGTDSGTFDYFVEAIFKKDKAPILASNPQLSEDDNVLVQGVEGSPFAIGYFGYAYFKENSGKLKVLSVEGIAPSTQTVDDGTYPLSRPLFLYSTAKILTEKPQVAAYLSYYLTHASEEAVKVGYFAAPGPAMDESKNAWKTATGGQ